MLKLGTPGYVAPEILNHNLIDFKSDLFSVGAILYNMIANKILFEGSTLNEIIK